MTLHSYVMPLVVVTLFVGSGGFIETLRVDAFSTPLRCGSAISAKLSNYHLKTTQIKQQTSPENDGEITNIFPTPKTIDRRSVLSCITIAIGSVSSPAFSAETADSSTSESIQSLLEKRSLENSLSPPPYGMEAPDIYYPSYFNGRWKAVSKTLNVYAPCGYELFPGGKAGYDGIVQREVKEGETLEYKARFVSQSMAAGGGIGMSEDSLSSGEVYIAADREFNTREIVKSAMGTNAFVDVSVVTPNRFSCVLAPGGSSTGEGNFLAADILAIARKTETISEKKFACSEVVRQIISPANQSRPRDSLTMTTTNPNLVKEIETISIYDVDDDGIESTSGGDSAIKKINCRQRTATYLVPSQTDPIALKKWQMSRGQPVDVRYYDVIYTRDV